MIRREVCQWDVSIAPSGGGPFEFVNYQTIFGGELSVQLWMVATPTARFIA